MAEFEAAQTISNTSFELESFRSRIEQLYIVEKRPLSNVMQILRQEGCHASRNMYLKKIRSWNLGKYSNREDTAVQRSVQNLSSIGQRVLYFGPLKSQPQDLDFLHKFFQLTYDIQHMTISKHMAEGSQQVELDNSIHDQFYKSLIMGTTLMAQNQCEAGGAFIERGLRAAELALKHMRPRFIFLTLFLVASMIYDKVHELAHVFVKFIYRLSRKTLGTQHTLTRLFECLCLALNQNHVQHQQVSGNFHLIFDGKMVPYDQRLFVAFSMAHRGMKVAYDTISKHAGRTDRLTLHLKAFLISTDLMVYPSISEGCSQYETYIKDCDQSDDPTNAIKARRHYAVYLFAHRRFPEAIDMLRGLVQLLYQEPIPLIGDGIDTVVLACGELGTIIMEQPAAGFEEHQKRYQEAEIIMKMAVEKSILLVGPQATGTVVASQALAGFYSQYGNADQEALQRNFVREQLDEYKL